MGAGRVLCDDVLRRRMRTCVLSVSSTVSRSVGRSVDPGTTSRHFVAETKNLITTEVTLGSTWCAQLTQSLINTCSPLSNNVIGECKIWDHHAIWKHETFPYNV